MCFYIIVVVAVVVDVVFVVIGHGLATSAVVPAFKGTRAWVFP